jgi:hypothetical protein
VSTSNEVEVQAPQRQFTRTSMADL